LEKLPAERRERSFLDIGTGSGVLAIAAAKLGYHPVEAFDFDPEAVRTACANARRNRVLQKMECRQADLARLPLRSRPKFDVICANLLANLLVVERNRILARLKPKGLLVLAGVLKAEFPQVARAYRDLGLRLVASRSVGEWRSGAFRYAPRFRPDESNRTTRSRQG